MPHKYLLLLIFLLSGCDGTTPATGSVTTTTYHSLGMLPQLIYLPRQPLSVKWEMSESAARNTGNLAALLEFSPLDKAYILQNSPEFDSNSDERIDAEFYDAWLPDKAKVNITTVKHDSTYVLPGVTPLKPDIFTQTNLSPYVNGSITPLSNGYILVSLFSM